MARYEAVRQGLVHVGVKDNLAGAIYHLIDDEGKICIDWIEDDETWRLDSTYQQIGSDTDVQERADILHNSIKELNDSGVVVPYHASGDGKRGLNCENLVGLILEGNAAAKAGQLITVLEEFGFNTEPFLRGYRKSRGSSSSR